MNRKTIILAIVALVIIGVSAFTVWFFMLNSSDGSGSKDTQNTESQANKPASTKDITELISSTGNLSTLNDILQSTGVSTILKGEGPFTVFAPTNAAFTALPSGTLERLQKPENNSQLSAITKYHVAAGSLLASQLTNGQKVKTLNDQEVVVSLVDKNVYIIDAKGGKALVTKSDIKAKNGVIQTVDAVLLPQ